MLDRMITTKYPLGVVLMKLAAQFHLRGIALRAKWLPRLQNEEADAVSNFDFSWFDAGKRIEVDFSSLNFCLLNDLFAAGDEYIAELEQIEAAELARAKASRAPPASKRRRKGLSLEDTDPW